MITPEPFTFTFPCFSPMADDVNPHTFNVDGIDCIIIATDYDILDEVFKTGLSHIKVQMRAKFESPETLLEWLKSVESFPVRGRKVSRILVDPKGEEVRWNRKLSEFIQLLESSLK